MPNYALSTLLNCFSEFLLHTFIVIQQNTLLMFSIGKSLESQQNLKCLTEEFFGAAQKAYIILLTLSHTAMCFFTYMMLIWLF